MNYEDVISCIYSNPGASFTGIKFSESDNYLSVYTISSDKDDPEWITIFFEGGKLFSTSGEEGCYVMEDAPDELTTLHFKNTKALPFISEYTSEYVLYELFPNLPDPDDICSEQEKLLFISEAKRHINELWYASK
ncbi:hypothetical protein [Tolumonas auensis]|uniref:hypothetical protein n=1 Tax=Tolumonas auensis TaxID=43948 RepID=UPI002AA928D9|nr:hypothetical protein [Tolumonas auensis]